MAGDVPPPDPSHVTLLGWLSGLATATVGALGLWLAQRVLGKAAFQQAINDGFTKLTDQLQEERDRDRAAFEAARIAWAAERASLKGEIRNLTQTVESLENFLRRHGLPVPERPALGREAEPGATIIESRR